MSKIEFINAMGAHGYVVHEVVDDGQIQRFKCSHDKAGSKSGRYQLHTDGVPNGAFGCFHDGSGNGMAHRWRSDTPMPKLSPAQVERVKKENDAKIKERAEESKAAQAAAAVKARTMWEAATPAKEHPYATKKGIEPAGLKVDDSGLLLIPLFDESGEIVSIQTIDTNGFKRFSAGGRKSGCYHFIKAKGNTSTIYITEGWATGQSVAMATGAAVMVAFDAGNLLAVAQLAKSRLTDGQTLIIAGDNDSTKDTNTGADKAKAAAQAVGCAYVLPTIDGGSDWNDLHQAQGLDEVAEQLNKVIHGVRTFDDAGFEGLDDVGVGEAEQTNKGAAYGFTVNNSGVWFTDDKGENMRICARLDVLATTRDTSGNDWGVLLRWSDKDKREHTYAMPIGLCYGTGSEVAKLLAGMGLVIQPHQKTISKLNEYLVTANPKERAQAVSVTGWHGQSYVLPHTTHGGEDAEIKIYQSEHQGRNPYAQAGTAEDWINTIGVHCSDNSRLAFGVSLAFAGVLLPLAGIESGGFHFVGSSATGKTTLAKVAASVYGTWSGYAHKWRATDNGLEGVAAMHNHALLILDEIGQANSRTIGDAIYMLGNGAGKVRATRGGLSRQATQWEILFLSTGEKTLESHMSEGGKSTAAGQEVRCADIDANAGAGLGAWDSLGQFESGAQMSEAIEAATKLSYGVVGSEFIRLAVQHKARLEKNVRAEANRLANDWMPTDGEGQAKRVAVRCALVAVAGEQATQWGLTGWQSGDATKAAKRIFSDWKDKRGGGANSEESKILESLRSFLFTNGSRFEDVTSSYERPIINKAGFIRDNHFLVEPQTFKSEACKGLDFRTAIKVLDERGLLNYDAGKHKTKRHQKQRFYWVSDAIFDDSVESVPTVPTPINQVVTPFSSSGHAETSMDKGFDGFVPTMPTVPTEKNNVCENEFFDEEFDFFCEVAR